MEIRSLQMLSRYDEVSRVDLIRREETHRAQVHAKGSRYWRDDPQTKDGQNQQKVGQDKDLS